jgi:superfamily II DNA or RNA helicase
LQSASFQPGAVVLIRREKWRVASIRDSGGVYRVDAERMAAGHAATVTFFVPFDQIDDRRSRERPRRVRRQRWHALLAAMRARAEHVDLPLSALDADIRILPYQLEPLLAIRNGARRMVIADAVGLGKTIQAGLIVSELIRRGEARRILIAAPSHLCRQWQDELRTRFHVPSREANAQTLEALAASLPRDVNPWSMAGTWIGSIDFLKQIHVLGTLLAAPWDLVVIDEAHTVAGHSERRAATERLTISARSVVLLTATPVSGIDDGQVLASMGRLYPTEPMTVFRRSRADVGIESRRRTRTLRVRPSDAERRALDLVDAFAGAAHAAASASTADATALLVAVFVKRALSTFAALAISADRRLAHLSSLATSSEQVDAAQQSFDFGDGAEDEAALTASIGMPRDRERSWMRRLSAAAHAAARRSRKMSRLMTLIARTREPVIVFTEVRDSLEAVAALADRAGMSFARAHGALPAPELDAALTGFRDGRTRILIATDVASQGLNLHQSARWIIHVDLPWNPIRLEQRAGRVDRMGQHRDVHVTSLVMSHASDRAFVSRLTERTGRAAASAAFVNHTHWRRRASAAAIVLEQRRQSARCWRNALIRGRPLATRNSGTPLLVSEVDIGGKETLILCSTGSIAPARSGEDNDASEATARVRSRARRITRLSSARAARALKLERALRARMIVADPEPVLPGTLTAAHARQRTSASAETAKAQEDVDARIAMLESQAEPQSPPVSRRVRLLRD